MKNTRKYNIKEKYGCMRSRISVIVDDFMSGIKIPIRERIRLLVKGFYSPSYLIYNLEENNLDDYLSDYHRRKTRFINGNYSFETYKSMNNKLIFDAMISEHAKTARTLAIVLNGKIYIGNKEGPLEDFRSFLEGVAEQKIVLKPYLETGGGRGVSVIQRSDDAFRLNDEKVSIDEIESLVRSLDNYMISEHIAQENYGESLFSGSLNTIRVLTLKDPLNNAPYIAIAVQRMGCKDSIPVDNWSSGGFSANIDLESGELGMAARFINNKLTWHETHPDTGTQIKGVKIPNWQKVKGEILSLAANLPYIDYVGWDIVPLSDGIVVVEGNSHSDVDLLQVHKPLLKDEVVKRFYKYHSIIKR